MFTGVSWAIACLVYFLYSSLSQTEHVEADDMSPRIRLVGLDRSPYTKRSSRINITASSQHSRARAQYPAPPASRSAIPRERVRRKCAH